ncbi:hypothetical protein TNCV_4518781 [Trichonephila clavipes]|nr:hypothetical protein TNCV_4518781 [Trichonephila clavipes]
MSMEFISNSEKASKRPLPQETNCNSFLISKVLSLQTIWSSPPSQQTACAFTPLVPPPSGHTSSPPKPC